ncbi:MAG: O-antigen ligase family protein [Patescibacteria group bacterium]
MQTNKILRYSIFTGFFLLPFICLIVSSNFFFPFITGKNFAFRIIVEIITGLWIILALRDKTALPKSSRLLQAFALFIAVIFVSDLLSPNVYKSFWSNFERMEGWVTLAHLFALFVVLSSMMTKKLWEWLFRTSIGVSLILFVYGCFQISGKLPIHQGSTRIDTTIGNSAYLGGYMLFHIFLALYFFCTYLRKHYGTRDWQWFWPVAYGFAVLADTFILFETATRGAEIGFVLGLLVFAATLAFFERKDQLLRRISLGILILMVFLGGLFVLGRKSHFVANSEALHRLGSFVDEALTFDKTKICNGELKSRCLLWPIAFQGVKENPILGWGQESFNYVFNKYYDPRMYSQEQWFDRTHNVFLDWLIAGGILGLLSYLSLFGVALYYVWRKKGPFSFMEKGLITGLLVAYFVHNLTVFDNLTSYILFVMVLAWIESSVEKNPSFLEKKLHNLDHGVRDQIIIPIVSVGVIFIIYIVNVPAMLASSTLIAALSNHPGGPSENIAYYEKAFSYGTFADPEILEQLIQATNQAATVAGVDPKIKSDFFNLATERAKIQLKRTPDDARYFLFAGSLASSFGDFDTAITDLSKAVTLSPKKQTIMFSLGTTYLAKGDSQKAVEVLKTAFDLDPSYDEARRLYALALVYDGKISASDLVLKPLKPESVLADQRFIIAYYTTKAFTRALQSLNALIVLDPTNPQNYFTRAAVFMGAGRTSEAIADLNKAATLNPSTKPQVDQIIQQIRSGKTPQF